MGNGCYKVSLRYKVGSRLHRIKTRFFLIKSYFSVNFQYQLKLIESYENYINYNCFSYCFNLSHANAQQAYQKDKNTVIKHDSTKGYFYETIADF